MPANLGNGRQSHSWPFALAVAGSPCDGWRGVVQHQPPSAPPACWFGELGRPGTIFPVPALSPSLHDQVGQDAEHIAAWLANVILNLVDQPFSPLLVNVGTILLDAHWNLSPSSMPWVNVIMLPDHSHTHLCKQSNRDTFLNIFCQKRSPRSCLLHPAGASGFLTWVSIANSHSFSDRGCRRQWVAPLSSSKLH